MEFRGNQSTYVASLPPVEDTPLFQRYDSLYRALEKATATNPDDRFQSADELRDQLLGVLREVVAVDAAPGCRALEGVVAVRLTDGHRRAARVGRPSPLRIDHTDAMATWLAGVTLADGAQRWRSSNRPPNRRSKCNWRRHTPRSKLVIPLKARSDEILADNPWEWRAVWL